MIYVTDLIFSGPMIEANWRKWKNQTRRLALTKKGKPSKWAKLLEKWEAREEDDRFFLWVKENFARTPVWPLAETIDNPMLVFPMADNFSDYGGPWKPSIHMRRADSRLTLEITHMKAEPVTAISKEGVLAEGIRGEPIFPIAANWQGSAEALEQLKRGAAENDGLVYPHPNPDGDEFRPVTADPREAFKWLWESLHGEGTWELSPTVVGVHYKPVFLNIDEHLTREGLTS